MIQNPPPPQQIDHRWLDPLPRLQAVVAQMPGFAYWKNAHGYYCGCNQAILDDMGFESPRDIIGKNDKEIGKILGWPSELIASIINIDAEIIQTGIPQFNIKEIPIQNLDGKQFPLTSNKIPIFDNKGVVIGILGISLEMHTQKTPFKPLKDFRFFDPLPDLHKIIAWMPGCVYWKNTHGFYCGSNQAVANYIGFQSPDHITGKNDAEIGKILGWSKGLVTSILAIDKEIIQTGIPKLNIEEKPLRILDGKQLYFITNKVPIFDNQGKVAGIIGISIDISERKKFEQKIQDQILKTNLANKAKTQFLSMMSHELRSPLNNILNALELAKHSLQETTQNHTAIAHLDLAIDQTRLVLPMIADVAKYIALGQDTIKTHCADCDPQELVTGIVQQHLSKKPQAVDYQLSLGNTPFPDSVSLDVTHLYETLSIVISNAFKYTEQGGVHISMQILLQEGQGHCLKITIKDTGCGIYADQLKNITSCVKNDTMEDSTHHYRKPAFRLPYAQLLTIMVMKGQFHIESSVGVGTTVTLSVPCQLCSDFSTYPLEPAQKKYQLLFVEDNPITATLIKTMLEKLGHFADIAKTGQEAIQKAQQKPYDLILMDIGLPDIDGVETAKTIWRTVNKDIPIVALTSHSTEENMEDFINQGMLTVLTKPVTFKELARFFEGFLRAIKA